MQGVGLSYSATWGSSVYKGGYLRNVLHALSFPNALTLVFSMSQLPFAVLCTAPLNSLLCATCYARAHHIDVKLKAVREASLLGLRAYCECKCDDHYLYMKN